MYAQKMELEQQQNKTGLCCCLILQTVETINQPSSSFSTAMAGTQIGRGLITPLMLFSTVVRLPSDSFIKTELVEVV